MPTRFDSARHQAALATPTGYRRWMRFTASRGGQTVELEPVSGSLTQDNRREGRWDGRLSFVGNDLLPTKPSDILTPFGTLITVDLGIELLDGSVSTVPYGVYEIGSVSTRVTAENRAVDVSLSDLSGTVERYRFESPLTVPAGTDLGSMVNTVISNRTGINPGVGPVGTTFDVPRVFGLDTSKGPWSEMLDVLTSFSRTAWYDRTGDIQIGVTTADADAAYPLPSLASLSADFDTRPPNIVVVRGEPQDGSIPIQATAMDTDPSSPTYAGTGPGTSPYGRVTLFYSSPLLKSQLQAQIVANTLLAANVGAGATYTITVPYDPTITAGDVVAVEGSTLAVDSVTVNLTGDTSLQVRELG